MAKRKLGTSPGRSRRSGIPGEATASLLSYVLTLLPPRAVLRFDKGGALRVRVGRKLYGEIIFFPCLRIVRNL